jgi:hypothetical protein
MTWKVSGSCSWRLTPRMTIGRPLTATRPSLISTVRKPMRWGVAWMTCPWRPAPRPAGCRGLGVSAVHWRTPGTGVAESVSVLAAPAATLASWVKTTLSPSSRVMRTADGLVALGQRHVGRQQAVAIGLVEAGVDEEVGQTGLGRGLQIDRALDARDAPEVLVFQVAAVGPAVDLDGHHVLLSPQPAGRDVELAGQLGVLGIAGLIAVDPDPIGRAGRADVQDDVLARPARRHLESAAIGADRVGLVRDQRPVGRGRDR